MTDIHGHCHDAFAPVREAFADNFSQRNDVGASVAVSFEGEMVVDLWGGAASADGREPWQQDTIVNVYSTTKTMAALCLLMLKDQGEVDLHAPVSRYWPEFAQNGKERVEVRHFLSHSAGLSGLDEDFAGEALYDWERVCDALARQAPWWEPGTQSGYHALTQGYLIGEVVRRVTGVSLGQFFKREVADPLQADFHIGTPAELNPRIGELIPPPGSGPATDGMAADSIALRTFKSPAVDAAASRSDGWRQAEIPAANGHGNARSVVRVQSAVANGGSAFGQTLLSQQTVDSIFDVQTQGEDLVLGVPITFGMGYGLSSEALPMGPNQRIAYWGGWGGSSIVVDCDAKLCVSYVMNRMEADLLGDMRGFSLLAAAYQSIAV